MLDGVRRFFARQLAWRDEPYWLLQQLPVHYLDAGVVVTMDDALALSAVWACIDAISKGLASCMWNVYTLDTAGRRTMLPNDTLSYILNVRPNPDMPAISFRQGMYIVANAWGNAYAEIVPDGAGRVAQLWPLQVDRVTPKRNVDTWEMEYEYDQPLGGKVIIPASRMYHLRGPGVNGLMGDNMVARMAKSIALAMAAEKFSSTYFGNNTVVGGVLEYPKTLDDKTYARLRESWEERFKGPNKAHKPAILEGGMKWTPYVADGSKTQMVEARKFQLEEIARWFGVPLHKLQHLDRATFNNIEHLGIEFVRDALTPWAIRSEQEADYKLFSRRGPARFTKLDTAWLSYGDAKSRAEYYQIMRRIGVYSANEIRAKEGDNSIGPEGDIRVVESNMQTLENLLIQEEVSRAELESAKAGEKKTKKAKDSDIEDAEIVDEEDDANARAPRALPSTKTLVNDAAISLFASTFERYVKRVRGREADLVRNGVKNGKVSSSLAREKERLRCEWLVPECSHALDLVTKLGGRGDDHDVSTLLCEAVDSVDAGKDPREAAALVVSTLMTPREVRS